MEEFDLQKNPEIEISSQTRPRKVRIILPSLSFPNACKVFESLSKIIKTFQRESAIFIFPLFGDELYDRYLKNLFQEDTEQEEKGVFIYSAELIFWDNLSFSKNCASFLATEILRKAIEKEKKDISDLVDSASYRIKKELDRWKKSLLKLIRAAGEGIRWFSLVWNFGFGRRENGYIRLATLMNPSRLDDKDVQGIFSYPSLPAPAFIDIFQEFERNIKTFYCPDFDISPFDITKTSSLEEKDSFRELPFNSPFWKGAISVINNELNQVLQMLRTAHTNQRTQVIRDVSQKLSDIKSKMHLEVEQEINHLRDQNDLLELHPERPKTAYERVNADIFSVIIKIFPHLWGLRGLPLWIPSLIYPLRAPVRHAVGILRETLRLLLFYRVCYHILFHFRKTIENYLERFINLQKELPGYKKHIENLEQELNIIRSPIPVPSIQQRDNLELRIAPARFPECNNIFEALEGDLKALCTKLIEDVKTTRVSSNFKPEGIIAELLPAIVHGKEAWLAAQHITEAFQKWEPFQNTLSSMLRMARIDPNTNVVFYKKRSKKVVSILDEELFLEWKRRVLKEKQGQFRFDILTPQIKDEDLARDFILKNASELGFLESDGTYVWVSKRWFRFIPESIKYIFFQRKIGLTQIEIKRKADSSQKEELRNWLNWFFYKERGKDCSGFNTKKDKGIWEGDIVDTIFSFLDGYLCTDPPSHQFYGKLDLGENELRFILKDTLSRPLMKLFSTDDIDYCEPRRFPNKNYITTVLDLNGLKDVIYVLLNIAIYKEKDVSKFKRFFHSY